MSGCNALKRRWSAVTVAVTTPAGFSDADLLTLHDAVSATVRDWKQVHPKSDQIGFDVNTTYTLDKAGKLALAVLEGKA